MTKLLTGGENKNQLATFVSVSQGVFITNDPDFTGGDLKRMVGKDVSEVMLEIPPESEGGLDKVRVELGYAYEMEIRGNIVILRK